MEAALKDRPSSFSHCRFHDRWNNKKSHSARLSARRAWKFSSRKKDKFLVVFAAPSFKYTLAEGICHRGMGGGLMCCLLHGDGFLLEKYCSASPSILWRELFVVLLETRSIDLRTATNTLKIYLPLRWLFCQPARIYSRLYSCAGKKDASNFWEEFCRKLMKSFLHFTRNYWMWIFS